MDGCSRAVQCLPFKPSSVRRQRLTELWPPTARCMQIMCVGFYRQTGLAENRQSAINFIALLSFAHINHDFASSPVVASLVLALPRMKHCEGSQAAILFSQSHLELQHQRLIATQVAGATFSCRQVAICATVSRSPIASSLHRQVNFQIERLS